MPSADFITRVADLKNLYEGQKCPLCGRIMMADRMAVGFRIPPSQQNIEEYSETKLYHPVNYGLVCSTGCAGVMMKSWAGRGFESKLFDAIHDWDTVNRERKEKMKKKKLKYQHKDWREKIRELYGVDEREPQTRGDKQVQRERVQKVTLRPIPDVSGLQRGDGQASKV